MSCLDGVWVITPCAYNSKRNATPCAPTYTHAKHPHLKTHTHTHTCTPTPNACKTNSRAGDWPRALALLEGMESQGSGPDVVAYTTAISALGRAGKAAEALRLFERMRARSSLCVDEGSYHAALDACARGGGVGDEGGLWRQALRLVREMEEKGMGPGRLAHQSGVQACAQAGRWEEALALLRDMGGTSWTNPW